MPRVGDIRVLANGSFGQYVSNPLNPSKPLFRFISREQVGGAEEEKQSEEVATRPLFLLLGGNANGDIYRYGKCDVFSKYNVITTGLGIDMIGTDGVNPLTKHVTEEPPCDVCGLRCEKRVDSQRHPFIDVSGDWNDPIFWTDLRKYLCKVYGRYTVDIVQFPEETQKYITSEDAEAIALNIRSIMEPGGYLYVNHLWIESVDTGPTYNPFEAKNFLEFLEVFDFDDSVPTVEERNVDGRTLHKKVLVKYGIVGDRQISKVGYPDWLRGRVLRPMHLMETPLAGHEREYNNELIDELTALHPSKVVYYRLIPR